MKLTTALVLLTAIISTLAACRTPSSIVDDYCEQHQLSEAECDEIKKEFL